MAIKSSNDVRIRCKWTVFILTFFELGVIPSVFATSYAPPGLDFKDNARSVCAHIDITEDNNDPKLGYLTQEGFKLFLNRVSKMSQLESLSIVLTTIPANGVDIAAEKFRGLTNLTSLVVCGCGDDRLVRISSISNWWTLPIKSLELSNVFVPDPWSIGRFRLLENLKTSLYEIVQAAPVALDNLFVVNSYFKDALDLSRFPCLESLTILNVKCAGIFGLSSLKELKRLYIDDGPCIYLDELARCSKLRELHMANMDNTYFVDFSELGKLPLECLWLDGIPIRKIRGLEKCPLSELFIQRAQLREWSDICRLPKLEKIDVSYTSITNGNISLITNQFPKIKEICYSNSENSYAILERDDDTERFTHIK